MAKKKKRRKIVGWVELPSPKNLNKGKGDGWFGELDAAYVSKEKEYSVMTRDLDTELGIVTHVCMRNKGSKETNWNGTNIHWKEKQRIKKEILGYNTFAIEVLPSANNFVNGANMYHLWSFKNSLLEKVLLSLKRANPEAISKYKVNDINVSVLLKEIDTEIGKVSLAYVDKSEENNDDIPWISLYNIKNEVFGKEAKGVELYPGDDDVFVEKGHFLWILHDFEIPFSI